MRSQPRPTGAPAPRLRPFDELLFRAGSSFALVAHRRLPPDQRQALQEMAEAPDHYGLLVPRRSPELGVLAVDRDLARLLRQARTPRTAAELRAGRPGPTDTELARLLLDGVLEVARGDGFVGGPACHRLLLEHEPPEPVAAGPLSALSVAALRWAQVSTIDDPTALSGWLYAYHRVPASPEWLRRLGRPGERDRALRLEPGGAVAGVLARRFAREERPSWTSWRALDGARPPGDDEPTYKLYVSPLPGALAEALSELAPLLVDSGVPAFKLGAELGGLLRPDKLVVYCTSQAQLRGLAGAAAAALSGCPAHGVPFTAGLSPDGLLSWGVDPPRSSCLPGWRGAESWRLWVTDRLARALLRARSLGCGNLEPWRYALLRLGLEGVDTADWLPARVDWGEREVAA